MDDTSITNAVIAHLHVFQNRTPGGSFRMNKMVGWDSHALAEWQLVDRTGNPGFPATT